MFVRYVYVVYVFSSILLLVHTDCRVEQNLFSWQSYRSSIQTVSDGVPHLPHIKLFSLTAGECVYVVCLPKIELIPYEK